MESVLAAGIIREIARSIRSGAEPDHALREQTRGASKPVQDLVIKHIASHVPRSGKIDAQTVRDAILAAAKGLT